MFVINWVYSDLFTNTCTIFIVVARARVSSTIKKPSCLVHSMSIGNHFKEIHLSHLLVLKLNIHFISNYNELLSLIYIFGFNNSSKTLKGVNFLTLS